MAERSISVTMAKTPQKPTAQQRARLEQYLRMEYPSIRPGTPEYRRAFNSMVEKQAWENFKQTGSARGGSTSAGGAGGSGKGGGGGR